MHFEETQRTDRLFTSSSPLSQLLVLNEARKHLSVHEKLQELADPPGRVRLAEIVALQLPAPAGRLCHVERVVAHQLHEEPHEPLRHQRAQVSLLTCTKTRVRKTQGCTATSGSILRPEPSAVH